MKYIVVAATSRDGYLTKGDDSEYTKWVSQEDKEHFATLRAHHNFFVMGSTTYDNSGVEPSEGTLRLVLTRNPEKYAEHTVPGQLEFSSMNPEEIKKHYKDRYDSCLVLGGSYIYTQFLASGLVDEIYLTIEPVTHGRGVPFIRDNESLQDIVDDLPTPEVTQLNNTGTQLKHYKLS